MKKITLLPIFLFCSLFAFAQNSALTFDGTDEFLSITHNDVFNIGNGFTIEAWIFADEWKGASWQGSIMTKDNQGPDRGFAFRCGDNGALSFVMAVDNTWEEVLSGQVMNAKQWHHVAVVIDNGTMRLYIDGKETASHSYTGTPSLATDLAVHIGASVGFGGRNFAGTIDEVRVWDDARTDSEIEDNMTADLTGTEDNLVVYFPMNEGAGMSAGDATSTGNVAAFNAMDETNWVDGYTLPEFDVAVKQVYGLDVVNMITRPIKLSVDLQNTGVKAITDIDLSVLIDGTLYNKETFTNTINAGELVAYEFSLPVDVIGMTDPLVEVLAEMATDGNTLNNTGVLPVKTGTSKKVIVTDKVLHKNGQGMNSVTMTLPNDLHKYEEMILKIDLSCPGGGCGDWDVLADLKAVTSSGTYELARYITPYGIACGGWEVDITDFKSVLGKQVTFLTRIDVFTERGWLLDMSIELDDEDDNDTYTKLHTLWEKSYHVYGDPGISYDLNPIAITFADNTEESHMRMTISGHGQGNTANAAEFFNATHNLEIDGSNFAPHNLWKADCASNPCADQAGNWLFPRAGWCPGQEVAPFIFNTNSKTTPGASISLDYVLQTYTNFLNTGYNNNGHTEPYYRMYSYFIESSASNYREYRNLYTESTTGNFDGNTLETVDVKIANDGLESLSNYTINIYHNRVLVKSETFAESIGVGEAVDKNITVGAMVDVSSENIIFAEVVQDMDDNPGDNTVKSEGIVNTQEILVKHHFDLFPNPTTDGLLYLDYDAFWNGSIVKVFAANGTLVESFEVKDTKEFVDLKTSGMYWYSLSHPEGHQVAGKIIFTK